MGKITYYLVHGQFSDAGEAIEAEFRKLADQIEKVATAKAIGDVAGVGQIESSIEAVEEQVKAEAARSWDENVKLESLIDAVENTVRLQRNRIEALESYLKVIDKPAKIKGEPVPTDRHGKPEGGLEPGDVISWFEDNRGFKEKHIGIFSHCEKTEGKMCAHGSWQNENREPFNSAQGWMPLDRITFEFRPKYPGEV